ncbi:hypothetical protein F383_06309 [Gossypium arboreum]|uniref:Uncharacterized protein n=1 Tax=Gossypium arboreum TaxID=29729 RepID=A0A0B0NF58_GOSAR|nr:hypothetical protein F383_06309 [Gossypium arboreum]
MCIYIYIYIYIYNSLRFETITGVSVTSGLAATSGPIVREWHFA